MRDQFNSPEQWANEAFLEAATGGRLNIFRNFYHLLTKIGATSVLVFFHRRFGVRVVNYGSTSWGVTLLFLILVFSSLLYAEQQIRTGQVDEGITSRLFYTIHLVLFFSLSIYHWIEGRINLRRRSGGEKRYSYDLGESLLWPLFSRLFSKTSLIYDGVHHTAWYALTQWGFQKWVEPMIAITIGIIFYAFGLTGYGTYLLFCGVSIFLHIQTLDNAYFELRQQQWDAKQSSETLQVVEGETKTYQRTVVRAKPLSNVNKSY